MRRSWWCLASAWCGLAAAASAASALVLTPPRPVLLRAWQEMNWEDTQARRQQLENIGDDVLELQLEREDLELDLSQASPCARPCGAPALSLACPLQISQRMLYETEHLRRLQIRMALDQWQQQQQRAVALQRIRWRVRNVRANVLARMQQEQEVRQDKQDAAAVAVEAVTRSSLLLGPPPEADTGAGAAGAPAAAGTAQSPGGRGRDAQARVERAKRVGAVSFRTKEAAAREAEARKAEDLARELELEKELQRARGEGNACVPRVLRACVPRSVSHFARWRRTCALSTLRATYDQVHQRLEELLRDFTYDMRHPKNDVREVPGGVCEACGRVKCSCRGESDVPTLF